VARRAFSLVELVLLLGSIAVLSALTAVAVERNGTQYLMGAAEKPKGQVHPLPIAKAVVRREVAAALQEEPWWRHNALYLGIAGALSLVGAFYCVRMVIVTAFV
jgi:hypothetical protein